MQLPDVFLKVKVPAEAFSTGGAGEGLLVIVCVHVEGQVVDLVERFAADGTLELFLSAVGQLVVFVVSWKEKQGSVYTRTGLTSINSSPDLKIQSGLQSIHQSSFGAYWVQWADLQ